MGTEAQARWQRPAAVAVVVGSLVVTAALRPRLPDDLTGLGWFLVALAVVNVVYFIGVALCAAALARHASSTRHLGPLGQLRQYGSMRRWSDETLSRTAGDRWFWIGFTINWAAATVAALVPAVAVVVLLPPSGWGLLAISALDLTATMVLRVGISRRLRRFADGPAAVAEA